MRRVVIVGCGAIAKVHAKNLRSKAELFFCSRSQSSAEQLCRSVRGAGVFSNFEEVLVDPKTVGVVICSPPEFHSHQVVRALEAGKSVLVEKPLCLTSVEMEKIEKALAQSSGALMVAENYYYKPSLRLLKKWIADGIVGRVRAIFLRKVLCEKTFGWKATCGALIEGGIHFLALLTDLADAKVIQVRATFPGYVPNRPERHSIIEMQFENGVNGKLEYSWSVPSLTRGTFQHSVICGDRGKIVFESNGLYAFINTSKQKKIVVFPMKDLMGYQAMTKDFLLLLNGEAHQPYANFFRVRHSLEVVWKAYGDQVY